VKISLPDSQITGLEFGPLKINEEKH